MKKLVFWNFVILVLVTVCLCGCQQARDVGSDIIFADPSDLDAPDTSDTGAEQPMVAQEQPPETADQTPEIAELPGAIGGLRVPVGAPSEDGADGKTENQSPDPEETKPEETKPEETKPEETLPPDGLSIGDEVIAQNTRGGRLNGLRVRRDAGLNSKIIGGVFDGATGTITAGPEFKNDDGYTWWKVRWNPSDSVICDESPCEGWSVEFFGGSRILAER